MPLICMPFLARRMWAAPQGAARKPRFSRSEPRVSARACPQRRRGTADREVYDNVIFEPYLMQCGFLKRTSRGRMVTAKAYKHLKMLG